MIVFSASKGSGEGYSFNLAEMMKGALLMFTAFAESDVRLLQTLAGSMGIALENARLGEKLNAARSRIEALLKQIPETES